MRRKSLSRDRVSVTRFVSVSLANGNDAQCRKLIGIRQIKLKKKNSFLSPFLFLPAISFDTGSDVVSSRPAKWRNASKKKRQQRRNLKKSLALIFKKEKLIISKIIGRGHYNYTQNTYTRPRKSNQNFYRLKALAGRNFMAPHVNFLFPLNLLHHHPLKMKVIKV